MFVLPHERTSRSARNGAMNNWLEYALKALPILAPVVSLLLATSQGAGKQRRSLAHDAEVASKLPEGPAREAVLALVQHQAEQLRSEERRRDLPMLVLSLIVAILLGYLTIWLVGHAVWWAYVLAALAAVGTLLFIYIVFDSAQNRPRDTKDEGE